MATAEATTGAARAVQRVADTHMTLEGAGVPIRRALPSNVATYDLVDPFLLLDHFRADASTMEGGFPPHPHRGFEIVTYLLAGSGSHSDSEGNSAVVHEGGLQRITAGRGIWHGEGPGGADAGPMEGLQLWINLAQAEKRIPPGYQGVEAEQIPVRTVGDAQVRVLVGEGSPTQLRTPAVYLDVQLPAGGHTDLPAPEGFQGFAYVLSGNGTFGGNLQPTGEGQVAVLGPGNHLPVVAGDSGVRFVLAVGAPHRERVRWNGPYVD
ncbi:MAG: pirin family protein [Chloroflexota bacterium]